jgi:hypothetical protein
MSSSGWVCLQLQASPSQGSVTPLRLERVAKHPLSVPLNNSTSAFDNAIDDPVLACVFAVQEVANASCRPVISRFVVFAQESRLICALAMAGPVLETN